MFNLLGLVNFGSRGVHDTSVFHVISVVVYKTM